MIDINVDDIAEIDYDGADEPHQAERVTVLFKDGTQRTFEGPELPAVFEILNHWTPPTA